MALIAALGISMVLAISGAAAIDYATKNFTASGSSKAEGGAYGLAEAGINSALSILANQLDSTGAVKIGGIDPRTSTLLPSTTVNYPELRGSVTFGGSIDSNYVWTITSTGTEKVGKTTRRTKLTRKLSVIGINAAADGASWSRFYQDSISSCLTIDNMTFVTNVATRGNLCIADQGAITGASTTVDVGGTVTIMGPSVSDGPRSPSAVTAAGWTSATNAYTSNNLYATYSVGTGGNSTYLELSGFGFSLPATAVVRGISVSVERKASSSSALKDDDLYIRKSGCADPCGTEHADTANYYGTSDATVAHGSSSDLWGKTWTPAEINSSSFGIHYRIHNFAGSASTASIDAVTVTVTYTADTNGIGTSGTPVSQANIGGTCTYNGQAAHTPCSSTDHVNASTITSTPAASNGALVMPEVDFTYWWRNAKPGPKHFCTNANPGLSTSFFDNDAGSTNAPNGSISVNGEMAPATSDYDCQFWESGSMVGQLKWNHTTHRMDIKGVVFIDGNFRFDDDGEIIHYYGRANLMSSRDDEIDAVVCSGGATDSSGNPTGLTYATSCLSNMSSWDPTQNEMVLMSEMPDEYDQGSTTCTGSAPSCYGGYKPAGFQGIMYSTSTCQIHQEFQDSGPVICNTIDLPDQGLNPTFFTFPFLGNLTDGQKYHDTVTATHFELVVGQQSG